MEFSTFAAFGLLGGLQPHQLTLDVGSQGAFNTLSESCLKSTFMRIHADLYANVEDWDLQVGAAITKAIYKFLCLKSDANFGTASLFKGTVLSGRV